MTPRAFALAAGAVQDLQEVWLLVASRDGAERADRLVAKIEAFCLRLADVPNIGTRHDERYPGLRSVGVVGLRKAMVQFTATAERVTVLRVGYLGRNVWAELPWEVQDI